MFPCCTYQTIVLFTAPGRLHWCHLQGRDVAETDWLVPPPLCPNKHPPTEMFGTPLSAMQPRSHRVCGSSDCRGFIRLHISVVSIELRPPPPLVALLVCLPVAAVTVEVEQAHWFSSPQQAYCCCCSHFSIYGSVYLARALSVCTAIKIL